MTPSDERYASAGPALAIGLAVALLLLGLLVIKLWYIKHRRIQTIHAPQPSVLPTFHPYDSLSFATSTTPGTSSIIQFGYDSQKLAPLPVPLTASVRAAKLADESFCCAAASPNPGEGPQAGSAINLATNVDRPKRSVDGGVVVGMLGSPDWEIGIVRRVDGTTRSEAMLRSEVDLVQRMENVPVRPLSRMSSRTSVRTDRRSRDTQRSPYLSGPSSSRTSSPSLLTSEFRSVYSQPGYNTYQTRPLPPKAQVLLDITETSIVELQDLESAGIAVPAKARVKLGIMVPMSPPPPGKPSPTTSEFSVEMQFAQPPQPTRPPRMDALGFSISSEASSSTPPRVRRKPPPSDMPSTSRSPPLNASRTPQSCRTVTFSEPQRPSATLTATAPPRLALAHQRMRSLDSLKRVRVVDPCVPPLPQRAGIVGKVSASVTPRFAKRRSRSLGALPDVTKHFYLSSDGPPRTYTQAPTDHARALSASTALCSSTISTPRKIVRPAIQIISPSPVKPSMSLSGLVPADTGSMRLAPPAWGGTGSSRSESPSPTSKLRRQQIMKDSTDDVVEKRTSSITFPSEFADGPMTLEELDVLPLAQSTVRSKRTQRARGPSIVDDVPDELFPSVRESKRLSRRSEDAGSTPRSRPRKTKSSSLDRPSLKSPVTQAVRSDAENAWEESWTATVMEVSVDEFGRLAFA